MADAGIRSSEVPAVAPLPLAVTLLSFGAAAIHFGVSPDHFAEYVPYGVAFALLGWFQVLWGAAYVMRPGVRLGIAGAVVNVGVVAVWMWSRTIGLPIGPNPGTTELLGVADSISSAFEVLVAVGVGAQLTVLSRGVLQESRPAAVAVLVAVIAVVAASLVALVALAPSAAMG